MIIESKLKEMGLELPPVADPAGLYVYTRRVGNLVYVSGQTPDINSVLQIKGVVGEDLTIEEGKKAAKLSAVAARNKYLVPFILIFVFWVIVQRLWIISRHLRCRRLLQPNLGWCSRPR